MRKDPQTSKVAKSLRSRGMKPAMAAADAKKITGSPMKVRKPKKKGKAK